MEIKYAKKILKLGKANLYDDLVEMNNDSIEELKEWLHSERKFQTLFSLYEECLGQINLCRLSKNYKQLIKEHFQLAVESVSAYSTGIGREGKELNFVLNDKPVSIISSGVEHSIVSWENVISMGVIGRSKDKINDVLSVDFKLIKYPEVSIGHKYKKYFIKFLTEYLGDGIINNDFLEEMERYYNEAEEVIPEFKSDFSFWIYLYRPLARAIQGLYEEDQRAFNENLIESLKRHHNLWCSSKPLNKGGTPPNENYDSLISYPCTALAAMAYDKGWKLEVESDYMPDYMVDGTINS